MTAILRPKLMRTVVQGTDVVLEMKEKSGSLVEKFLMPWDQAKPLFAQAYRDALLAERNAKQIRRMKG